MYLPRPTATTPQPQNQNQIEYVSADLEAELAGEGGEADPALAEFKEIFAKFATAEELCGTRPEVGELRVLGWFAWGGREGGSFWSLTRARVR